jgi:hypothetical protein
MKRLHDWRSRLHATIEGAMRTPFAWGTNDCALFAGACVLAVTGEDFRAPYIGTYDSAVSCARRIARDGHKDVADLVLSILGPESEIHPSRARRGDLAVIPSDGAIGTTIGVFDHERIGAVGLTGYATVPRASAQRAFKVG